MFMKRHIIAALREEFNQWEEMLTALTEQQANAPQLASNRSIKDELAHLHAWQQRSIARVEAALLDQEPEFPKWPAELDPDSEDATDRMNEWIYQTTRIQPWPTIYQDWKAGFLRFLAGAETISEKDLLDSVKYPWLDSRPLALILLGSYDHHHEHLEILLAL